MYQFLTGDKSDSSISRDVLDRLHVMLDCQDPEVVFDLRDNNPGRPECYGDFLRNQVLSRHPDISAPSVELIRCQFWPQNPFHKSSERYTGRFD